MFKVSPFNGGFQVSQPLFCHIHHFPRRYFGSFSTRHSPPLDLHARICHFIFQSFHLHKQKHIQNIITMLLIYISYLFKKKHIDTMSNHGAPSTSFIRSILIRHFLQIGRCQVSRLLLALFDAQIALPFVHGLHRAQERPFQLPLSRAAHVQVLEDSFELLDVGDTPPPLAFLHRDGLALARLGQPVFLDVFQLDAFFGGHLQRTRTVAGVGGVAQGVVWGREDWDFQFGYVLAGAQPDSTVPSIALCQIST